jgi:hypothetical protein
MEKTLKTYIKENSDFVSIKDGESYSGIYKGYKFIEKEVRGETKEYVRYSFEDLGDKKIRTFDSRSLALADKMSEVKKDSKIKVGRTGDGFDTKYEVEFFTDEFPVDKEPETEPPTIEENGQGGYETDQNA